MGFMGSVVEPQREEKMKFSPFSTQVVVFSA